MSARKNAILGILGGLVGLGTHAALLVVFFTQSHGLFQVFLHLALAAALGLVGLVVAILCRRSPATLVVLLPAVGVLGFVPRPLSWAPAGVLLVAAGIVAGLSLRNTARSLSRSRPQPVTISSDRGPLHWSEAARLGVPAQPAPPTSRSSQASWSPARKTWMAAAVAVTAAIVVAVSVLPWDSAPAIDRDSPSVQGPAATSTTLAAAGDSEQRTTTSVESATSSALTTSTTDNDGYDTYVDEDLGFSLSYPSAWRNTDPGEVGPRVYGGRDQASAKAYQDSFVSAAFADWQGPTYDGCYLDFVWVEAFADPQGEAPPLGELKAARAEYVQEFMEAFPDVELLVPIRDVQIGMARGFKYTWAIPMDRYTEIVTECVLLADGVWYYLALASAENDWDANLPIFESVLQSFTVTGTSPVI